MISSVLGAVIMSAATVAMLATLNFSNKVLNEVGKNPLSGQERKILIDAGFNLSEINLITAKT